MGGEITWECLSNGRYRFIMKLYRECAGINFNSTETLGVANYPGLTSIPMNRVSQTDISPICNPNPAFPHITCPTANIPNMGAVEEHIYTSDAAYPAGVQLIGVPPPQGWIFYHADCCRNPCTNIINAPTLNWFLRAVMYPYNNQPANPCYDNSPKFAEVPSSVICTGYPFTYNHNAWDPDLDSLTFEWGTPLININQPVVTYAPGYSYLSPLPGTAQNPNNVPATVDLNTGEISFTSFTQGAFVTVVKVTAYKCGIKVAEIFREMQIVLISCGNNGPPSVTAPFIDPNTGLYTLYADTIWAGDFVSFNMSANDIDLLPDGSQQTLTLTASGPQFGLGYTNINVGCLNPPCAVLSSPPPVINVSNVSTSFNWQTTCNHINTTLGCGSTSNVYTFVIKVHDDFCPAPAIAWKTITIVVKAPPVMGPPEIRCLEVLPNGDVSLTWLPPDTGAKSSFNSYHVYYSNSSTGPFSLIDSIFNYNTTTYTHIGANANLYPGYYYLVTRSGCNGSIYSNPSKVASTIFLTVNNTGSGVANLNWSPIYNPLLPSSSHYYNVYREYLPGNWVLIDSTSGNIYNDTITFCNALVNYKIEIYDSIGCLSVSNVSGSLFQDITPPNTPIIDSVSVDNTSGKTVIGWQASSAFDTEGYIIYQNISGIWKPIDTVWGIHNTFYINNNSFPANGPEAYRIAAFDSCLNTSPLGIDHQTIHLNGALDVCQNTIMLYWTPYIHLDPPLGGYRIWMKENNNTPVLLDTVSAFSSSYSHTGLNPYSNYCYYIQAYDNNTGDITTSSSNIICIVAIVPKKPQYVYLKVASVEQTQPLTGGKVRLECFVDTSAYVAKYIFERAESLNGNYTAIGSLGNTNIPIIKFYDASAKVDEKSYYYRVIVLDSCSNPSLTSNVARTIYLTVQANDNLTNTLSWNDYEYWLGNVDSYNIYRIVNGIIDPSAINVPFGVTTYTDDITLYSFNEGKFSYVVSAIEGPLNYYGFSDTSYSNIALALQNPKLFIPNAFIPAGYNTVFKPFGIFIEEDDYLMEIYNRWGQRVFNSNNYNVGWDGTFENQPCPPGVYVYRIQFKSSKGDIFVKHGTVTLIR